MLRRRDGGGRRWRPPDARRSAGRAVRPRGRARGSAGSGCWASGRPGLAGQQGARAPASRADLQHDLPDLARGRHRRIAVRDRRLRRAPRLRRRSGAGPAARAAAPPRAPPAGRLHPQPRRARSPLGRGASGVPHRRGRGRSPPRARELRRAADRRAGDGSSRTAAIRTSRAGTTRSSSTTATAASARRCSPSWSGSPSARDGVRCDMAMLLEPEVIARTWGERAQPARRHAARRPRRSGPRPSRAFGSGTREFLFVAEAYWDLEWALQEEGFDFTYDKRLYDRLRAGQARPVREHLAAAPAFRDRTLHFLENHDEPRAAAIFPPDMPPRRRRGVVSGPRPALFPRGGVRRTPGARGDPPRPADGGETGRSAGRVLRAAAGLSAPPGDARRRLAPLRLPRGLERQPDLGQLHRLHLAGRGPGRPTASCWPRSTTVRRADSATRRSRSTILEQGVLVLTDLIGDARYEREGRTAGARGALSRSPRLGYQRLRRPPARCHEICVRIAFISARPYSFGIREDEGLTDIEDLLQKTSRTFALTIPCLPQPTRDEVGIAYLLFRIIDTFEDAVLWTPGACARRRCRSSSTCSTARPPSQRALAESWTREPPLEHAGYQELLARTPVRARRSTRRCARRRRPSCARTSRAAPRGWRPSSPGSSRPASCSSTPSRICATYCYAVAGIVGEMLTELFLLGSALAGPRGGRAAKPRGRVRRGAAAGEHPQGRAPRRRRGAHVPAAPGTAGARCSRWRARISAAGCRRTSICCATAAPRRGWSPSTPSSASWPSANLQILRDQGLGAKLTRTTVVKIAAEIASGMTNVRPLPVEA